MSSEQDKIQKLVEEIALPPYASADVRLGYDWTGDPAAYVMVTISDEEAKNKEFPEHAMQIDKLVADAFREAEIALYPYVDFRSASDAAA